MRTGRQGKTKPLASSMLNSIKIIITTDFRVKNKKRQAQEGDT